MMTVNTVMTVTSAHDGETKCYLGPGARGTPEKRVELVCWICFYLTEPKTVTKSSGSGSGYSDSDYDDGSDYEWK